MTMEDDLGIGPTVEPCDLRFSTALHGAWSPHSTPSTAAPQVWSTSDLRFSTALHTPPHPTAPFPPRGVCVFRTHTVEGAGGVRLRRFKNHDDVSGLAGCGGPPRRACPQTRSAPHPHPESENRMIMCDVCHQPVVGIDSSGAFTPPPATGDLGTARHCPAADGAR
jgi:hypothetical protein